MIAKKSQATIYIILGLAVLFVLSYLVIINKNRSVSPKEDFDTAPIVLFSNECIKKVAEDAMFEKIGKQGGYLNPETETDDQGMAVKYESVQNYMLPYHYYGGKELVPPLEEIKLRVGRHVAVEISRCMDFSFHERQGYKVSKPQEAEVSVDFNDASTIIDVIYPIKINKGNSAQEIKKFNVVLPIRFIRTYNLGSCFLSEIKSGANDELKIFLAQKKCAGQYADEFITLHYIDSRYVLVYDYKTWFENYGKTFKYQFAVDFT